MSVKKVSLRAWCVMIVLVLFVTACSLTGVDGGGPSRSFGGFFGGFFSILSGGGQSAVDWMSAWQDQFHSNYFVFWDDSAAGNHFNTRGKMGTSTAWVSMIENDTNSPQSGISCIKATFAPGSSTGWGGVYFLNGLLKGTNSIPIANWGESNNAGVDLSGATELSFWAKGSAGGETVEFICFGVGRNTDGSSNQPYPDANVKLSTNVTLTTTWNEYKISLSGANLSYVLGGFAWVMTKNGGETWTSRTIYIDNIKYDKSALTEPRFMVSYKTLAVTNYSDLVLRNVAYTYDNALAIMAFLAYGQNTRAQYIADAMIEAQTNDRYFTDGRLRNAYLGGSLKLPAGWTPNGKTNVVSSPGWWDGPHEVYYEDEYCLSTDTGNMAWAILGWLAFYGKVGGSKYLDASKRLGDWIANNTFSSVGAGGFTAGYTGWETTPPQKKTYKSTEHNLDLYAAFKRLYDITGETKWFTYATNASNFVMAMWDNTDGYFYAGTDADGITTNTNGWQVPLDCQSWTLLSFRTLGTNYHRGLDYATNNMKISGTWGFDFNNLLDGIWYEGTAQMATAFMLAGKYDVASNIVNTINDGSAPSGAMYATSTDWVGTGYWYDWGQWCYWRREHVGATAWAIFAEKQINAFWMGTTNESLATSQTNEQYTNYTPGLTFTLINNNTEYKVYKGTADTTGTVITPDYYNGLKVTAIGFFLNCTNMTNIRLSQYLTTIDSYCFNGCNNLSNLSLPNSVTNIGESAFLYCKALHSINIPSGVKNIARNTFLGCYALSNLQINGALTNIDTAGFYNCTNLKGINLSNELRSIGESGFFMCRNLTNVTLPNSLSNIGNSVFMYCYNIKSIDIPGGVKNIGDYLFFNCSSLTNVTVPITATNIGSSAFSGCSLLGQLSLPTNIPGIRDYTFQSCSQLSNITIPDTVTFIGQTAFTGCTNIKSLTIPSGVTNIGRSSFSGIRVKSITLPSGVTIIPDTAFSGCSALTNFVIHSGITNIGSCAFQNCTSMTTVIADPTTPPVLTGYSPNMVFVGCYTLTAIKVPAGSVTAYQTATGWSYYSNKIVAQ